MQTWYTTAAGYPGTYGDADGPPVAFYPAGATPITEAQYDLDLAAWQAGRDAYIAGFQNAECLARKAVYDDLVANTTLSDATAHALSGWEHGSC